MRFAYTCNPATLRIVCRLDLLEKFPPMPFSQERTELIKAKLQERLASESLNEWERSFFNSMLDRFNRDGTRTSLTNAQYKKLHQLLRLKSEVKPVAQPSLQGSKLQIVSRTPNRKPTRSQYSRRPRRRNVSLLGALYAPQRAVRRATRQAMWPLLVVFGLIGLLSAAFETVGGNSGPVATYPNTKTNEVQVVIGSSVNQRSGPGTAYAVMGQLKGGTRVRVNSESDGWTQISSNLGTGWMSSRYLRPPNGDVVSTAQSSSRVLLASDIRVIDGDTIDIRGQRANVRLVGFNTPETGSPQCNAELDIGLRATSRLRDLIQNAQRIEFERVACACRPGTEGTKQCNYGRQCGVLKTNGTDVGSVLITEGLAVRYVCGRTSCPPRPGNWCR